MVTKEQLKQVIETIFMIPDSTFDFVKTSWIFSVILIISVPPLVFILIVCIL